MKYDVNELKHQLYSGILCDVMDGMGYRNQAISNKINPLNDETVIFGPAFTSIGTEVYSMPEDPLTAQCKVVDQFRLFLHRIHLFLRLYHHLLLPECHL